MGSYRPLARLASGGMGTVDLCVRQTGNFQRLYAIKRLREHLRDDVEMRRMFLDEARVAGLIRHSNVVAVLDVGEDDQGPFLVMDYVEGVTLAQLVRRAAAAEETIPPEVCGHIVAQASRGLHAAHELHGPDGEALGLVHRDVSPQNVLIGRDGLVRVADFGISKALGQSTRTSTGVLKGKLGYMSPEQLRFETLDRRSDVFALGVVLYELVTAQRLYRGADANAIARRILREPPPDLGIDRPDVPPAAVELTFQLLAKDRGLRPPTAQEVAVRLEEAFADLGPVDLQAYVGTRFDDELGARRLEIQTKLASASATAATVADVEPRAPRRWIGPIAAAAVAIGGLAAGAVLWPGTEDDTVASTAPKVAPAEPSPIRVEIETRPAGATVRVGGRVVGVAPIGVELPRGPDAVELSLELLGYEHSAHRIVPQANERLVVALKPSAPTAFAEPITSPVVEAPAKPASNVQPPRKKRVPSRRPIQPRAHDPSAREPESESEPQPRFRRFD